MAVLEVKELTKKYGQGESEVIALDHVSFSVERGEFVAIVGVSGSGKSTLMNMIGGIDYPTSGSVIIEENDITAMNEDEIAIFRRRNLGIIYQFYNLIPTLTAEENIVLPWKLDGRKENKIDWQKSHRCLDWRKGQSICRGSCLADSSREYLLEEHLSMNRHSSWQMNRQEILTVKQAGRS